jgi:DNA repair protein RadC
LYRVAIHQAACSIILAHNHPSGNLNPSETDIKLTNKVKAAGKIIGIELFDHIIFSDEGFYSFANEGML